MNSKSIKWESLITSTFTGNTEITVATYNGRKISDYSAIVVMVSISGDDARNTFIVPDQVFAQSTTRNFHIDTMSGVNGENFHQNVFRYVNDTTVALKRSAGSIPYMEIFGLKY